MIIDSFNLNLLRVFECVYRHENMTKASTELGMTQSGVSQNIRGLEEVLQLTLFDRIKKKPIPTESGHQLYAVARDSLYGLEASLKAVVGVKAELSGTISIGLPMEFGNNIVLPILSEFSKKYPKVKLKLKYGHAIDMNHLILKGDLDFAIVDNFGFGKEVSTTALSSEEHVLCASKEYAKLYLNKKLDRELFKSLDYISYIEGCPLVKKWLSHHYGIQSIILNEKASLMNARGVSRLIWSGLGVGILPKHMVQRFKALGEDFIIIKGSKTPMVNTLSVAYLDSKTMSSSGRECIDFLTHSLKN